MPSGSSSGPEGALPPGGRVPRPVVCGVDADRAAAGTVRLAARMAERLGAPLLVAHAIRPAAAGQGAGLTRTRVPPASRHRYAVGLRDAADRLLARAVAAAEGTPARRTLLSGHAAHALARAARERDALLLVVGTAERPWWQRLGTGSVAQAVARAAPCPVVVVPERADARVAHLLAHLEAPQSAAAPPPRAAGPGAGLPAA